MYRLKLKYLRLIQQDHLEKGVDELRVIKVLRSHLDTDEDLRQRFLREAKTAIQLRHPNLAQLYDFSVDEEGNASIVLEYIDGLTLAEFGRQPEARDPALALAISGQALRALGFLHRKGFVHRGIAPDKLMLAADVEGGPAVKLVPGGWADINEAPSAATVREVYEETGYHTRAVKLLALYDRRLHGHPPIVFHAYKIFFLCELLHDER